jgi:PAS domain S-box-containing protein
MKTHTILIVDDNLITRKMVQAILHTEGYIVLQAEDGRTAIELVLNNPPDLILQDINLPDMDGCELIKRFRLLPGCNDLPIIAFSSSSSSLDKAQSLELEFTDFISKPVESSYLINIIEAYLPKNKAPYRPGEGRHILAVDDDPVQLKLLKIHLDELGFRVTTGRDGVEALDQARALKPDVIVSDVLMPKLDGFRLCQAIRQDPELETIPIILISAAYIEEPDQILAKKVGANALILRTPNFQEIIEQLLSSLNKEGSSAPEHSSRPLVEEYTERVIHQLERQTEFNMSLARRLALQEAELDILAGLAETTKNTSTIEMVLIELLHRCLDTAGASKGAAYLFEPGGNFSLRAQLGFLDRSERSLSDFFGHLDLLRQVIAEGEPVVVPSSNLSLEKARDLLEKAEAKSILVAPLALDQDRLGVLMVALENSEIEDNGDLLPKVYGNKINHVISLARTLTRLKENEERLTRIVDTNADGIVITDQNGQITFVNAAAEKILGLKSSAILERTHNDPAWKITAVDGKPFSEENYPFVQVVNKGEPVYDVEYIIEHPNGRRVTLSVNAAPLRDSKSAIVGMVSSMSDITERKRAEEERAQLLAFEQEARRQAEEVNRIKDEFLATLSHELRTPLTSVLGWVKLLKTGNLDSIASKRALDTIERNAKAQVQLIEDLLDVSRIITGKFRLEIYPVDPILIVKAAVDSVCPATAAKEIQLQLRLNHEVGMINADPIRLQQIIWNLLSNAIKFTPPSGRIELSLDLVDDHTQIKVSDSGKGIDNEFLPYVFDRFRQADGTITRLQGGLGLGLAIVRHLVELHGGTVHAFSSGDGQGSTFTVKLPRKTVNQESDKVEDYIKTVAKNKEPNNSHLTLKGIRVLLVDDDVDTLDILAIILEKAGAEVSAVTSVADALEIVEQSRPDVLVSDIAMPGEDGFSLIKRVRQLETNKDLRVPAVALTSYASVEDRVNTIDAGYQIHVSKPVDGTELIATIASLLGWMNKS